MRLPRFLAVAVLATAGAAGPALAGPLDEFVVGEVRPPTAIEKIDALVALPASGAKTWRYKVVQGAADDADDARAHARTLRIEANVGAVGPAGTQPGWMSVLDGVETVVLLPRDDKGLARQLVGDLVHEATLMPSPALPLLPGSLEPARVFEDKGRAIVVGKVAEDGRLFIGPDDMQLHGAWAVAIEHDADVTLEVPAGRFECKRIRTRTTITLKGASVEITSVAYYAPGTGLVAEERRPRAVTGKVEDERVRKLLLPIQPAWAMVLQAAEDPS